MAANEPTGRSRLVAAWLALVSVVSSCSPTPVRVGLVFDKSWKLGEETLTEAEKSLVASAALQTLRAAYSGFNVQFSVEPSGDRSIKIEDASSRSYGLGSIASPGAVGTTYPLAKVSSVYPDALYAAELAVARCRSIRSCNTKTREQLLEGLGRGIGATAAHELGHQAGLHFSRDSLCDDCYDSHSANTYPHFFATKHWSEGALSIMRQVLPRSAASGAPTAASERFPVTVQ